MLRVAVSASHGARPPNRPRTFASSQGPEVAASNPPGPRLRINCLPTGSDVDGAGDSGNDVTSAATTRVVASAIRGMSSGSGGAGRTSTMRLAGACVWARRSGAPAARHVGHAAGRAPDFAAGVAAPVRLCGDDLRGGHDAHRGTRRAALWSIARAVGSRRGSIGLGGDWVLEHRATHRAS